MSRHTLHSPTLTLLAAALSLPAHALDFRAQDPRALAMGGVGVASATYAAALYNPALLGYVDYDADGWIAVPLTLYHADTDDLTGRLDTFQQSFATGSPSINADLNALAGLTRVRKGNVALVVSAPSASLGGAFFINSIELSTQRTHVVANDPAHSTLETRGITLLENGASIAMPITDVPGLGYVSIGVSPKLVLVDGFGYSDAMSEADLVLDGARSTSSSYFNFDIGLSKEIGIWKIGLVVKDLLASTQTYGESNVTFAVAPQVRVGLAFQGRYSLLEVDLDLTQNAAEGYTPGTRYLALGAERVLWEWLSLRAGYRYDLGPAGDGAASLGIGVIWSGISVDVAALSDAAGVGGGVQIVGAF